MSWFYALIGLALGGLTGYLLARRFGDSAQRTAELQKELDRAREEHASYRRDVSDHFAKTAVAVNQLTESYRDVHQQLSEGAHALCDNAAAETALAFDQSRLIDAPPTGAPTVQGDAMHDDTPPVPEVQPVAPDAEDEGPANPTDDATADRLAAESAADSEPEPVPVAGSKPTDDESTGDAERPTSGGASWTPAADQEAPESPRPPRDYAEDDTGAGRG